MLQLIFLDNGVDFLSRLGSEMSLRLRCFGIAFNLGLRYLLLGIELLYIHATSDSLNLPPFLKWIITNWWCLIILNFCNNFRWGGLRSRFDRFIELTWVNREPLFDCYAWFLFLNIRLLQIWLIHYGMMLFVYFHFQAQLFIGLVSGSGTNTTFEDRFNAK